MMQKDKKKAENLHKPQSRFMVISVLVAALAILSIGWVLFKPKATASQPTVLSLKETWNKLENSAHVWQKDAYLTSVDFFVVKTINPAALQAMAEFHSLQVPNDQTVQVAMYSNGSIVNSPHDTMSVHASDPNFEELIVAGTRSVEDAIRLGDWSIDSQDALKIFAEDPELNKCLESSKSIITLSLNKMNTDDPTWVLLIAECPSNESILKSYYLNAKTGEKFDPFKP